MLRKGNLMYNIRWKLGALTHHAKAENKLGMTNINHDAEPFYAGLLNIVLEQEYPGIALTNLNALHMNFPAIDLADVERKVCVQVTTTEGRDKIQSTLDKYFTHELDKKYGFQRLIVLVIGEKPDFRKAFTTAGNLRFDHSTDVWDTAYLLDRIESEDISVAEKVDEYLRRHMELPDRKSSSWNLPLVSAMTAEGFVGREQELASIAKEIHNGTKPIFISGLGGMGKTELAVRFCKDYTQGNAYMVSFQDSFRKTLIQNLAPGIPGLLDQKLQEDELYRRVLHHLGQLDEKDILLIDNCDGDGSGFDRLKDDAYQELKKLPLNLIITTRCTVVDAIKADPMKEEQLRSLFDRYGVDIPVPERDALIHAVNSHTMTVDLMARTMAEGFMTTEQMLQAMATGVLDEDFDQIATYHDEAQRRIDAHLLALFRVADMSEAPKKILSCAILLPQGGMNLDVFRKALPEGSARALKDLEKRGWLKFDHGTRLLTIHPVIRLVCRLDLKNWKELAPDFLNRLHEQQKEEEFRLDVYQQLAEVYIAAIDQEIPSETAMWHYLAAWYLWKQGLYKDALPYEQVALARREALPDSHALDLAHSCNDIGVLYGHQGDLTSALEYKLKALEIRKAALPENHPDLATSYDNVGSTYGDLGDHTKALEYSLKALELRKLSLPENHPDLAISYNNVGSTYGYLGDHRKALEHKEKALEIHKLALPENHPDIARSMYNIAVTHCKIAQAMKPGFLQKQQFRKALGYAREALKTAQNTPTGTHLWMDKMKDLVKYLTPRAK